jgi:hypothetical protein
MPLGIAHCGRRVLHIGSRPFGDHVIADPAESDLGHATAAMTTDLYGHMIDRNLWDAAQRVGGTTGHGPTKDRRMKVAPWRKAAVD